MRAGALRNMVSIERCTKTRGSYGEEIESWSELSKAWADIKPLSGSEVIQGGQVDAKTTHQITIRFTDITPSDRIVFTGRVFNLTRVIDPDERRVELRILAIESV